MNVEDFETQVVIENEADLLSRLKSIRRGEYGTFILSHEEDASLLCIHINREVAYLHYFPDDIHPGYQVVGMTPDECKKIFVFCKLMVVRQMDLKCRLQRL